MPPRKKPAEPTALEQRARRPPPPEPTEPALAAALMHRAAPLITMEQIEAEHARARDYARESKAESTIDAYNSDLADFARYCAERQLAVLPADPDTIAIYLTHLADDRGYRISTLRRRIATISQAHKLAGYDPPPTSRAIVKETLKGIARKHRSAAEGKAAAETEIILAMLAHVPEDTLAGKRDRALLLIGFTSAMRRAELVALDVADVEYKRDGAILRITQSKTDQLGEGQYVGITFGSKKATCPIRSLKAWLEAADIDRGPIFRSLDRWDNLKPARMRGADVAAVVKKYAEAAGLDPALYGAHSLRAGFVTSYLDAGGDTTAGMQQTRHKSQPVFMRYGRKKNLLKNNPASKLGL